MIRRSRVQTGLASDSDGGCSGKAHLEKRYWTAPPNRPYDVSADGLFLVFTLQQEAGSASMVVVLNWFEELKAKLPGR
jgi:hypothetical protein